MESNSDTSDELDIINIVNRNLRRHILTLTLSLSHTHTHTQTSLTSFDLDHDTVETPEDLPLLPDYDKLVAKLVNSNAH